MPNVTFWCYSCESSVEVNDTIQLSDLNDVLTPLGWEHVAVEESGGTKKAWMCSTCLYCPDCQEKHGDRPMN